MNTIYTIYYWVGLYPQEKICKTYHYIFGKIKGKKYEVEILEGEYYIYCDLDIDNRAFAIDRSNIDDVFKTIEYILNKYKE